MTPIFGLKMWKANGHLRRRPASRQTLKHFGGAQFERDGAALKAFFDRPDPRKRLWAKETESAQGVIRIIT